MGAATFKTRKLPNRQVTERAARALHHCGEDATAGRGGRQNLENVKFNIDQKVVYIVSEPISDMGGAVGCRVSLAPGGAMAKVAEMSQLPFPETLSEVTWPLAGSRTVVRAAPGGRGKGAQRCGVGAGLDLDVSRRAEDLCE